MQLLSTPLNKLIEGLKTTIQKEVSVLHQLEKERLDFVFLNVLENPPGQQGPDGDLHRRLRRLPAVPAPQVLATEREVVAFDREERAPLLYHRGAYATCRPHPGVDPT